MITTLLWDVDGVILKPRTQYFSERLESQGHTTDRDVIARFFSEAYPEVAIGKRDLVEAVKPYMREWGWELSAEELLEYWFSGESEVNEEVVQLIKELNNKGMMCFASSDHSQYRADDLMERVGLKTFLDGGFFSGYVGCTKNEPAFWEYVLKTLGRKPDEVWMVDDDAKNVEVASALGINGFYFEQDMDDLSQEIEKNDIL